MKNAGFVPRLGADVLKLLNPQPGERVLDLGAGEGFLGEQIRDAGAHVVCVDASVEQITAAKARGLDGRVVDGRELEFEAEFDAVFSNAALHWMAPLDSVFGGVARALKPGGRFVAEMGGAGNVKAVQTALYDALKRRDLDGAAFDPWTFPGVDQINELLAGAGFGVESAALIDRPTEIPGDIEPWLDIMAAPFFKAVSVEQRAAMVNEVREQCAPILLGQDGIWRVDYVRMRFVAVKDVAGKDEAGA